MLCRQYCTIAPSRSGERPQKVHWLTAFEQLFLSDGDTAFSKKLGWTLGERTARYALIIDNGKITYAEKEPGREVSVSSAEAVLAKL